MNSQVDGFRWTRRLHGLAGQGRRQDRTVRSSHAIDVVAVGFVTDPYASYSSVMLGATNPLASAPGTIRGDYAIDVGRNGLSSCLGVYVKHPIRFLTRPLLPSPPPPPFFPCFMSFNEHPSS